MHLSEVSPLDPKVNNVNLAWIVSPLNSNIFHFWTKYVIISKPLEHGFETVSENTGWAHNEPILLMLHNS